MSLFGFNLLQGDPTTWTNPDAGRTLLGINASGQLTLKQSDGTITVIGSAPFGKNSQTSASGTVAVNPLAADWLELITLTGAARAVPILLGTAGVLDGWRLEVIIDLNNIAGLNIGLYSGATTLATFLTDGSQLNWALQFVYQGGSINTWKLLDSQINAHA